MALPAAPIQRGGASKLRGWHVLHLPGSLLDHFAPCGGATREPGIGLSEALIGLGKIRPVLLIS